MLFSFPFFLCTYIKVLKWSFFKYFLFFFKYFQRYLIIGTTLQEKYVSCFNFFFFYNDIHLQEYVYNQIVWFSTKPLLSIIQIHLNIAQQNFHQFNAMEKLHLLHFKNVHHHFSALTDTNLDLLQSAFI